MKALRFLALTASTALVAIAPAAATRSTAQYSSLTVFGDSLVDAGNYFINTNGGYPDAASGYFNGRFTNGYDYTDLLSLKLFGTPTVASQAGGSNYGLGGAHSYEAAGQIAQYQQHLADTSSAVDRNGLYVVNFGGNDIFYADTLNAADRDQYLQFAAQTDADAVKELNDMGVRNILVAGFPIVTSSSSATADAYLAADLAGLALNADTTVLQYSFYDFFTGVLQDPASVGLPPLQDSTSCIAAHAQPTCTGDYSFDGIHPTAAVDSAAFDDMDAKLGLTASLSPAPEPATWAMMLAGFGLTGTALRRRRFRRVGAAV